MSRVDQVKLTMPTRAGARQIDRRAQRLAHAYKIAGRIALYTLLIGSSLLLMIPLVWMISTSLKPEDQLFLFPPVWLPAPIRWSNYVRAWTTVPFGTYVLNTV